MDNEIVVVPSLDFRWVMRGKEKVLQQRFVITVEKGRYRIGGLDEWRDVPLVEEDGDE